MQQFLVNTSKRSCSVKLLISAGQGCPLYVVGYDPFNKNTLYFRSRFVLSGDEELLLNMPQSPRMLKILVWAENDQPYTLSSLKLVPLDAVKTDDPTVKFIEKFASICGRLRVGNYVADNVDVTIQLKRNIYTDDGQVHPTPSRIHTELPIIQVSKEKFDQMTIPERVIILLHEVSHNFINVDQDNEKESDQHGLDIYIQLGYPKIEAVNAFADIMPDTDSNFERMLNLVSI